MYLLSPPILNKHSNNFGQSMTNLDAHFPEQVNISSGQVDYQWSITLGIFKIYPVAIYNQMVLVKLLSAMDKQM